MVAADISSHGSGRQEMNIKTPSCAKRLVVGGVPFVRRPNPGPEQVVGGPSAQYLRSLAPEIKPLMVFGTRVLK